MVTLRNMSIASNLARLPTSPSKKWENRKNGYNVEIEEKLSYLSEYPYDLNELNNVINNMNNGKTKNSKKF